MRVLMVHPGPHYSVADVYNGWVRGLGQAGVGVADFNLDNRLDFYSAAHVSLENGDMPKAFDAQTAMHMAINGIYSSAFLWWPDVVIMVMGTFVSPTVVERLRDRGMHMVLLCTESPYEDERHLKQAEAFDTVIVNDPVNLDAFRLVNPNTHYIGHAFDPLTHYPGNQSRSGVGFCGTGFPSRIELLEQVDWSGLDLRLGGNWQYLPEDSDLNKYLLDDPQACMENTDTADLYRSSVAGFNCYRQEHHDGAHAHADGVACGPREIEMAACGLPFVRDSRPESDDLFPFLPTYDTAEDLESRLRWLVSDPSRAAELGRRARVAVARRTFAHNAAQLLRIIDKA
jgi:hypothetical protein